MLVCRSAGSENQLWNSQSGLTQERESMGENIFLPQPMVHIYQPSHAVPDSKTLSLQLTSVLPGTCYLAVLWPELWLQCQSDYHH